MSQEYIGTRKCMPSQKKKRRVIRILSSCPNSLILEIHIEENASLSHFKSDRNLLIII